jgi:hypothetical protein
VNTETKRDGGAAVERIARAISEQDDGALLAAGVGPIAWADLSDVDRDDYRRYARLATSAFLDDVVEWLEREAAAPVHSTAKTRAVLEAVARAIAHEFGGQS